MFKREEQIKLVSRLFTVASCVTFGKGLVRLAFHFFGIACINQAMVHVCGERIIQIKFYGKFTPLRKIVILV